MAKAFNMGTLKIIWGRLVLLFIVMAGLTACAAPMFDSDHHMIRGRVTKVWTKQEMIEDWHARLELLANAPPLEAYVGEYRQVTVYRGNTGRIHRFEASLSRSTMALAVGDVVEIDTGMRSRAPRDFEDIAMVTKLTCRASEPMCVDDSKRGELLGPIRN